MDEWLFLMETVRSSWRTVGKPSRVTAAVSGGADSVALLHALHALADEEGICLFAAHVDHGLRETSGLDAEFTAAMCRDLGVPCRVCRVQVRGKGEDAARIARYAALKSVCQENESPVLALAHHQRDQAETMLLHLFRGSGSGGLAGMSEYAPIMKNGFLLWRPLLAVSPETLRQALSEKGIPWREDETNASDDYLRNYVRHHVLPVVAQRIPQAEDAMGRAARILSDEADYFRQEANRFLARESNARLTGPCRWLRYGPLEKLHTALRRHVLRSACPVQMDWETTEKLLALSPGQMMNLPEGWRAKCSQRYLHFLPPDIETDPPALGPLQTLPWHGETGDGKRLQALPRSIYQQCELRYGKPGDQIHPLGGPGTKSMQDYWVDKKIDQPFRKYMPLLCIGSRVIWAIGTGVGEEARVNPGDDAVLLRYEGFLPLYLPSAKE